MRARRFAMLAMGLAVFGFASCDLFTPEKIVPKTVTFRGTVAVPDGPRNYVVLSTAKHLAYQWQSCPETSNNSVLNAGSFLLESQSNCAGAQFVYFYTQTPADLSAFAHGTIDFKVQVNNSSQQLTFLLQDSFSVASTTVSLSQFGYDPSKLTVDQQISIPVTQVAGMGFNLKSVQRVFQITAT